MTQPQHSVIPIVIALMFPVFFALFWLLITTALGAISGWSGLQRRFPANADTPLLKLRLQSGMIGKVRFNNALTLEACQSGLRVSVWRILAPFQHPFQVPWNQIEARPFTSFFMSLVRLDLGDPKAGEIVLKAGTWERLKSAAQMTV